MNRKVLALLLLGALGVSGCGSATSITGTVDKKALTEVKEALTKLEEKEEEGYQVSNVLQAPDGNLCYVELVKGEESYTEYPVDENGNYGTIPFQDAEEAEYILVDWQNDSGSYSYKEDGSWLEYPTEYHKTLENRRSMHLGQYIDKLKSLEEKETVTVDIGMGEEEMVVYSGQLESGYAREILGVSSEVLYSSILGSTTNENIKNLVRYYLDDISYTMVFSDANLLIGVVDGVLRYVQLEVGGLGTTMSLSKAVFTRDIEFRESPDLSSTKPYETDLQELADYVAGYDSYEEALTELMSGPSDEEQLDLFEENTESEEESEEVETVETE